MTDSQEDAARREVAARWFAELQAEGVSLKTWDAFFEWEQDPANAAAYREIEATLGLLDQTSLSRPGFSRQDPEQAEDEGGGRRPALLAMAAAAAALLIGVSALTMGTPERSPKPLTYATAIGAQKAVTLEDGSIVTLNTNTRLTVQYSKRERLIHLTQGEALFEVEHSDRPFLVDAGGTRTRALGTEFDIRTEEESVSVTLINGSVRVTHSRPATDTGPPGAIPEDGQQEGIVLKPGDRLDMRQGADPIVSTMDPARAGQWREGLLQFDNATLAEAIMELNRYSTIQLRIDDAALASERISGTFPAGKQAEFAESLALYLPVQSTQVAGEILINPLPD